MLAFLLQKHSTDLQKPGIRILELGSGSGWLGLNMAVKLPLAAFVLSDHPDALPSLRQQVQRVSASFPSLSDRVSTAQFEWGSDAAPAGAFDFVIGADLIYSVATLSLLPPIVRGLLTRGGVVALLQHTPGRKKEVDAGLDGRFLASGLVLEDVSASWQHDEACGGAVEDDQGTNEVVVHMPWLQDGGLFASEDEHARQSRPPLYRIYHIKCDGDVNGLC